MDVDGFKASIRRMDPLEFCRSQLFDQSLWLYAPESGVPIYGCYADLKMQVASAVDINPNNVAVVGSAKYGFSMSPLKGYRPFDVQSSDIDIVIVAGDLFETVWREMREAIYNDYTQLKQHHAYEIIMRFIVLKSSSRYHTTYLRQTARAIEALTKSLNMSTRLDIPFKYRVYASWKDVEMYHVKGINSLIKADNDVA
jgi:hypothetical protein